MNFNKIKAMVMAPHTDDGEFGAGGTIARIIEEGGEVVYVAYSSAEDSIPVGMDKNILKIEVEKATTSLGLTKANLRILNYKVRIFNEFRQEILDSMIALDKEFNPDIVLVPSRNDTHQDHEVISAEAFRAFKKKTILGYELPWNNINFPTDIFIKLKERHVNKKLEAIKFYESQKNRIYSKPDVMKSLAVTRGTQVGHDYAEAFELIRLVI